ncbi:MAG: hypothetical protein WAV28_09510 [Sedimentisphaerales bacterium]
MGRILTYKNKGRAKPSVTVERNKTKRPTGSTIMTRGLPLKQKKDCNVKNLCIKERQKYGNMLLSVCPLVKEVVNKDKFPNISNLPKTSSKNSTIIRILEVFRELIKRQQPTKEFIRWCAHRDNVLQDCMNLTEKDLKLLPKRYEKDYPQTSQKLEKLIKRLDAEMTMYRSAHNLPAFMLPPIPDELLKDYRDVLAWQKEKENPDESLLTFISCGYVSKMASLICHYPAVTIEKMNWISNELLSLEQIEIEKAKEEEVKFHNKALVELKEIIQNSEKPEESEQKEIVEVKPGAFGITVNIKEIAKRIWKRVCSRSRD